MNRRDFLKTLGFGGSVSALSACRIDDNVYYTPVEQYLPYVTRPEQATPGTNTHFATVVGTGPRAWPVVAVHRDGRVINVGANKLAPLPPSVPAVQLFDLQRHYSPDRWQGPRKAGAPVAWDAALSELAAAVQAARAGGRKVAYIGPYRNGAIVDLVRTVTGPENAVFWEPLGLDAEKLAAEALFGAGSGLPRYNLARAHYVLSFGAAFLGDAWGGAGTRAAFASARDANNDKYVARFVAVTPHKDQTAANADDWYACTPGSGTEVALAIARLVADKKGYQGPGRPMLASADPARAAAASGIPESAIVGIAAMFAAGGAVALPGGVAGASMGATRLAAATFLLNAIADERDLFSAGGYRGPISSYGAVEALMAEMEAGAIDVLLVDDIDPVYALPQGARFAAAMAKVAMTVAVSSHPNETNKDVKLALPTNDVFEDWGDEEPWAGFRLLRQPAMLPLYDTKPLGEILLAVAGPADPAAPVLSWRDWLKTRWAEQLYRPGAAGATIDEETPEAAAPRTVPVSLADTGVQRWWDEQLVAGFHETRVPRGLELVGTVDFAGAVEPSGTGEYHLHVFAHPFVLDGRYANEPWAQEVPDPMTGQVWNTWVLIHPDTASKLGVRDNDLVTLTTETGSVEIGVEIHPCVRPDVVAVPLGGGHTAAGGRYADGTGKNITSILAAKRDPSGALVLQQGKVAVASTGRRAELVSTIGHDSDENRNFVAVVPAGEWANVGDAETEHPGELTGIHHLKMDRRLLENEAAWRQANPDAEIEQPAFTSFYPVPDHPTYRFAMTIDTNSCNGCGACVVACYAENNLPVVGPTKIAQRREMAWIRINRYFADHTEDGSKSVHFVPMLCQHCGHAPCESVCPVLATYHTIDGLNAMVYNRCVGTRYCSNACPYSVRKFNYHSYVWPEPFNLQLNPDATARTMGVMEKCTFCVQRIRKTKNAYRELGFTERIPDEALRQLTACAEACPSQALTFGNLVAPESTPYKSRKSGRNYMILAELNTFPAINYLARASFHVQRPHHASAAGHGAEDTHRTPPAHEAGGH